MRKLITGIRTLFVCLAFVRTASHEEHNSSISSQNFLDELKQDIKLCKEHDDSKNTNGYTMFRVLAKKMEVREFYRLCQSLPSLTDSSEMISIITIRDLKNDKVYSEDLYIEMFTSAILRYINKNEDYVMLGTLGVIIDCIDKEHIENYDTENAIIEQIYNSHLIMSRLVMTFFYEICIDAFKDIIIGLVKKSLLEWSTTIYPKQPPVQSDDDNFFNRAKDKLAADLQLVLTNNNCINWVAFNYARKESAFDSVYQIVCENEKVNGLNHFASDICAAHLFYEYLILDQYGSLFKQGIDDIISKYGFLLQNDDYKVYFYDFLYDSMENLNVFYEQDLNYIDESRYYNWAIDNFCETESFLVSFHNYFEQIYTYAFAHQHRNIFQPRIDSLTCEVGLENVTNIIYSGPIDNENIRSLLNALRETKVFDKISQHQYIYLDDRKILSESEANTLAVTCDRVRFDARIHLRRVELIAKIKPETENGQASSVNKSIYKRHVFENDGDSMEYEDTNVVLSKIVLTIKNSTDLANTKIGESIAEKRSLCLVKNKSKMVDTNMISVSSNLGVSMICILRHETIEPPKINMSLVYDVPVGNFLSDEGHSSQAARLVRVLDNVPLTFLNDLQYQLRRVQLMDGISFTPPNFFTLKNIDLIYKTVTVEIGGPYETKIDIDFLLDKLNCKSKCYHSHCQLTFDQILEFEVKQTHGCEEISEIAKNFWLEERDLNQILLKFMPFFYTGNIVGNEPCMRYKHSTSRKIELFVTGSYNDCMFLHLCELQNHHYYHNITYNPLVVLAKILKTTNNSSAQKIVNESMTSYASFFPLLSIDVCKRLQNLVSNKVWANTRPGNVEIIRFIYLYIENVFASYLHQNDFNNRDVNDLYKAKESECIQLQKMINFDEIIALARDIQKCLHKITKNRKVKVVSIKINRIRDGSESKTKGKMLCESDEHFEDVSVFA